MTGGCRVPSLSPQLLSGALCVWELLFHGKFLFVYLQTDTAEAAGTEHSPRSVMQRSCPAKGDAVNILALTRSHILLNIPESTQDWGITMSRSQAVSQPNSIQLSLIPVFPNYCLCFHPSPFLAGAPQEFWGTLLASVLFHCSSSLAYPGKPEYFYIIDLISPIKGVMVQWTEYSSFLLEEWSCACSLGCSFPLVPCQALDLVCIVTW